MSEILKRILNSIPSYKRRANRISMDIAEQIRIYMKEANIDSQRDLATKIKRNESEISKWLSGEHNFTFETIGKIEEFFGKNILLVPCHAFEDLGMDINATNVNIEMYIVAGHKNVEPQLPVINENSLKDWQMYRNVANG